MIKKVLVRIIVYPFCAFIFWLTWQMTFDPPNYSNSIYSAKAYIFVPIGMIFSLIYPSTDILIFIRDFKKKKNTK